MNPPRLQLPVLGHLPELQWAQVVRLAPLVSIDLIVTNPDGEVLLGKRLNRPAKDGWFVPGGVVRKGEHLESAFTRQCETELGLSFSGRHHYFDGVYEHHYPDNFSEDASFGTHYVVLAHRLSLSAQQLASHQFPNAQHGRYTWMSPAQLLAHPDVHLHVKDYFQRA
ncbi:MAG: GDP-mannose mannosyl hydrolase [Burkholderiales bacterium]|jgi:colanic acid biosynthesis protein WcaH|nr:GDP-mannose mannosyl hydrolase [Burkholderiales bacterium]